MKNNEKEDLKKLNADQLKEKVESYRRELFSLKLTAATAHVKDFSQFNKLRKNLARVLTYMHQKSL